ncbi:MAG TPA: hypothetical protein VEL76_15320, partial [Gemmataceae bacterium]|nr:hypothetical protein [Gemmataceae bacterium]
MPSLTLRYSEDPVTGLPRLEGQGGSLSSDALESLQRELGRRFEYLASGPDGQLVALDGLTDEDGPCHFRVTVTERDKRCPTLLLEAVPPPEQQEDICSEETPGGACPTPRHHWQRRFLAGLADLLASVPGDGRRSPFDFVLADLRGVLRKNPRAFALLLCAGYLYLGNALSLRHGESGANRYAQAAQALLQFAEDSLPDGALASLVTGPVASGSASTLAEE